MYCAMAVRAEHATGPPVMLLTLRITLGGQAKAILRGTMKVANDQHTLFVTKPMLVENYPGFIETEQYNFSDVFSVAIEVWKGAVEHARGASRCQC